MRLDLRIERGSSGPFQPLAHAAWPTGIDARIDPSALWSSETSHLTPLFGRTIEPIAAEVRTRMLRHIGVVPTTPYVLDEAMLEALLEPSIRPTDLWIIVREATDVAVGDIAIKSFAASSGSPEQTELDGVLDRAAGDVAKQLEGDVTPRTIERLQADRRATDAELAALQDEFERSTRESVTRLDDLVAENLALRERLNRAELSANLDR